jgi:hypothetical protein
LPSINPPIRVLIRTSLAQLQKIDHSLDKADTELIKKLCDGLSFTDKTKIRHLITRISNYKKSDDKSERVDIILDYGSLTIEGQPRVMIYSITVEGSDLTIKQHFNPNGRKFVNLTVGTFESINLENNRCFLIRTDIRAETRRKRRPVLPVSKSSLNIRNWILISLRHSHLGYLILVCSISPLNLIIVSSTAGPLLVSLFSLSSTIAA